MEIIQAPVYVKLTEEERKTLRDAYDIFNELPHTSELPLRLKFLIYIVYLFL